MRLGAAAVPTLGGTTGVVAAIFAAILFIVLTDGGGLAGCRCFHFVRGFGFAVVILLFLVVFCGWLESRLALGCFGLGGFLGFGLSS